MNNNKKAGKEQLNKEQLNNQTAQRKVKCSLEIDGKSYRLVSDGSVEELKAIGQYVDGKIKKIRSSMSYYDKNKLYLSVALETAEDYIRLWQHYNYLKAENEALKKESAEKKAE